MAQDALGILKEVYNIGSAIYNHVQLVKANNKQCERLAERIKIVISAAKGLEQLNDISKFREPLSNLKVCLEKDLNFINKFTTKSIWFKYLLKTSSYAEEFKELNDELEKASSLLQLGLNAQQVFNRELDKQDQKADFVNIQEHQAEIIRLNQEQNEKLQRLDLEQKMRQELIQQQLESMQQQFKRMAMNHNQQIEKPPIDPKFQIAFHELLVDKLIKKGSFGNIYLGQWENSRVVIKMLEGNFTSEEQERFVREVNIMSRLRHPQVVPFYGACLEKGRACLIMPYYPEKDLCSYLKTKNLTPEQKRKIALDIAKGLAYLHNQNILHRSLKSSNILISTNNTAQLADFGLCKIDSQSIKTIRVTHEEPYWSPPEYFQRQSQFTTASDVFSYGVVLWEIFTGNHPQQGYPKSGSALHDIAPFVQELMKGSRLSISKEIPEELHQLLKSCWSANPLERPSLDGIVETLQNYKPRTPSPSGESLYEQGLKYEMKNDLTNALIYYKKAMENGHVKAHTNCGTFYLQGLGGVSIDKPKAAQLFMVAAQKDHLRAILNLANMYEYGDGVTKDPQSALDWYTKAVKLGDKSSQEKVNKLLERIRPKNNSNLQSMNF